MRTLCTLLILLCLSACNQGSDFASTLPDDLPALVDAPAFTAQEFTLELIQLINDHRADLGLRPLILSDEVSLLGKTHSDRMASGVVGLGHEDFSDRCAEASDFLGGGSTCAENVAMGQSSADEAFASWMRSPSHRQNIERADLTHTGIGYAESASGTLFWTQIFIGI